MKVVIISSRCDGYFRNHFRTIDEFILDRISKTKKEIERISFKLYEGTEIKRIIGLLNLKEKKLKLFNYNTLEFISEINFETTKPRLIKKPILTNKA